MSLEYVKDEEHENYFDWYNAAYGKLDNPIESSENDFGAGKTNTETMIAKWNAGEYGAQNACSSHLDMWGTIQEKVNEGWFVPSKSEWAAFGNELGITKENYANHKLSDWYWSSSQFDAHCVYFARFGYGYMDYHNVNIHLYVCLAATF